MTPTWTIVRGRPFSRVIRATELTKIWPTVDLLQVQSHLRVKKDPSSRLVAVLSNRMSYAYDGLDLVVILSMSGQDTMQLECPGYFDVLVSDTDNSGSRGVVLLSGQVVLKDTTTKPEEDA